MDVFALRDRLVGDYASYTRSFIKITDPHIQRKVDTALDAGALRHGAVTLVPDLGHAPSLIDAVAPEHLQLAIREPDGPAARVRHAGAIFLGAGTPKAVGDYVGGPNHVLPTSRGARFASGLGVSDFMKRTTLLGCGGDGPRRIGPAAVRLAAAEGLNAHGLSVPLRLAT